MGKVTALIVLAIMSIAAAHADAIIESNETIASVPDKTCCFGFSNVSFGGTFNQFDPSLGTLDAVTVNFSGTVIYTATFTLSECSSFFPCSALMNPSASFLFNAPGFPLASAASGPYIGSAIWNAAATDINNLSPMTSGNVLNLGNYQSNPSILQAYSGAGTVSIQGFGFEDTNGCFGNGIIPTCTDYLDLTTTLTYTYTPVNPVPEPRSLWMLMTGLVGLGLVCAAKGFGKLGDAASA